MASFAGGLEAGPADIEPCGDPRGGLAGHRFVGPAELRSGPPGNDWFAANVPDEGFVLRTNDATALAQAIRLGIGLGFMATDRAEGLVEVLPRRPEWKVETWLITHVDLHRSAKVQAFTRYFKAHYR